ncbi:dTDP-4-dehydrorhamnose reductase [soil metagenome]
MIVVLGAGGQLGTAFRSMIPDARFVDRSRLDLTDTGAIEDRLAPMAPSAVVNCAAYTAVDRAEAEEDLATVVNAEAVAAMARYAAAADIPLVTYSTDYVFAGDGVAPYLESDPTDPVNAYGRSKLAGERAALRIHPATLVIRTSWVVSATHPNFVATMLRLAGKGEPWRVVDDQQGCPTMVDDLAAATLEALDAGVTGILHRANTGATTWFALARAAVELAGFDPGLVGPCPTADYPTPARRPAYSVLGSERAESLGLTPLPPWRASLEAVVAGLTAA